MSKNFRTKNNIEEKICVCVCMRVRHSSLSHSYSRWKLFKFWSSSRTLVTSTHSDAIFDYNFCSGSSLRSNSKALKRKLYIKRKPHFGDIFIVHCLVYVLVYVCMIPLYSISLFSSHTLFEIHGRTFQFPTFHRTNVNAINTFLLNAFTFPNSTQTIFPIAGKWTSCHE